MSINASEPCFILHLANEGLGNFGADIFFAYNIITASKHAYELRKYIFFLEACTLSALSAVNPLIGLS